MSKQLEEYLISPLGQSDAPRVRLPWDSRFSIATLRSHLAEHPRLAFWNPAKGEYVVGSYWRGRRDIGMVIEASQGLNQAPLVGRLVSHFRAEGFRAAVLSQDEADRAAHWYLEHGWGVLDSLLVLRRRLDGFQAQGDHTLTFSPFQSQDLAAVTEVDRAAFPWLWWNEPADFLAYCASPKVAAFVARGEGQLMGYVSYSTRNGRGHLDRLAVHPSLQRKGYGSRLLAFALKRMREFGVREVGLTTQEGNLAAQEFYTGWGFAMTGESHKVYGLWISKVDHPFK